MDVRSQDANREQSALVEQDLSLEAVGIPEEHALAPRRSPVTVPSLAPAPPAARGSCRTLRVDAAARPT